MNYVPFGNTGLIVSKIGLGLAALGRPGYINLGHGEDLNFQYSIGAMEQRTHSILDLAWSKGISYYDTAQSYGKAETFLSSWLHHHNLREEEIVVGSKWGYTYTADWKVDAEVHEVKSHTPELFDKQWPESSSRLGIYLKLYQIHSATFESGVLDNTEVLQRLVNIKADGMKIGLSLSGPNQSEVLAKAMDIYVDGERLFDCVQATWNLLEPSSGHRLSQAAEEGMGIILKEVLANGRLTDKNNHPNFAKQYSILKHHTTNIGVTIDSWAIAAALEKPWAHIVLSGAATTDQLISNLSALQITRDKAYTDWELSIQEDAQQYWKNRKSLTWN